MKLNLQLSSQMPKGGDLHHHFSGSIYAEPILEDAISKILLEYYHYGGA
jgi:hypothetical protein